MTDKIEILAPAGNMDNLVAAVYSGANAVYLGVQSFNARASAANFSFDELRQAVSFCHARNVKVNVTLNTILYDSELESFKETVKQVALCGADAVIVQDLAAAKIIKSVAPQIKLHGSTQMAVHNLEGAVLLKEMGYSRVILARELSFEQVKYITENCGIETEIFIHGALCMSLSGQCYASAFLGGRSGNRGRCAGTCRLPMSARGNMDDNHLSLKDLCAMDMLTKIQQAGVKCVKIEGRLRTPEYVALAVDSAAKALKGENYDRQLLADTFSRSGFTNGFLENNLDKNVFGVRTKEDSEKTKQTLPKLRQLYRREGQYVPVSFEFKMGENASTLTVSDGKIRLEKTVNAAAEDTENDYEKALRTALEKLGGTPFFASEIKADLIPHKYLALGEVNAARRELVSQLLEQRSAVVPFEIHEYDIPSVSPMEKTSKYCASFEDTENIPLQLCGAFEYVYIPLEQWEKCPAQLKEKAVLTLGRDMFSGTEKMKADIEKAKENGLDKFCAQNIGHIPLLKGTRIFSSFTLNVSNSLAADEYFRLGVENITISPEITLEQIKRMGTLAKTTVLSYGHVPLMLVKACPLQNVTDCSKCEGGGYLIDRKGMKLPVKCHGKIKGYREIFNPIPLYLGERQNEVSADYMLLSFTIEDKDRIIEVIKRFTEKRPLDGDFTRGLYYKGSM